MTKGELLKMLEPFTDECKILLHLEDSDLFTSRFNIIYKTVNPFRSEIYFEECSLGKADENSEGALVITLKERLPRK